VRKEPEQLHERVKQWSEKYDDLMDIEMNEG